MKEMRETIQIGKEIYDYALEALKTEKGVHVETLVASLARLSGTSLLRSFNILPPDIQPGQVVLSDKANEEGPKLHGLMMGALQAFGLVLDQEKIVIDTPAQHRPHMDVLETQKALQAGFYEIAMRNACSEEEAAYAAAVATAIAINETKGFIDPHLTFGIAAYGMVEGSKTAPLPLTEEKAAAEETSKKSFLGRFRKK
jgi:hypothetical protein